MTFPSYSVGTVSVAADATTVVGTGTVWQGVNARAGDLFQIGSFGALITDVTDYNHLVISKWGGGAQSGAAYTIFATSPLRYAGADAMADVEKLLKTLNGVTFYIVEGDAPDPSLGEEGSSALKINAGPFKFWLKTGGVWVYQGQPAGLAPTSNLSDLTNVATARTNLGLSSAAVRADTDFPRTDAAQTLTADQQLQVASNIGFVPLCGRLAYSSPTAITFLPRYGDLIKISNKLYRIPSTGIAGLGNTGVWLNGLAAQNLAANTLYYVYAHVRSGVLTGHFNTLGHATSVTAGNEGVEINYADDADTLLGMIYTNASSQFAAPCVVSWFNRCAKRFDLNGTTSGTGSTIDFLTWADESIQANLTAWLTNSTPTYNNSAIYVDGAQVGADGTTSTYAAGGASWSNAAVVHAFFASEGKHSIGAHVTAGSGSPSLVYDLSAVTRG